MGIAELYNRNRMAIKMALIGILSLILLIPTILVQEIIRERRALAQTAVNEVSQAWSGEQTISGPVMLYNNKILLPETLNATADIKSSVRSRNIYKVSVYNSTILLSGEFAIPQDFTDTDSLGIAISISDIRGIENHIPLTINGRNYVLSNNLNYLWAKISDEDAAQILNGDRKINYELSISLKGTGSLAFVPTGAQTKVSIQGDYGSPSFVGNYLPQDRTVEHDSFKANWQVSTLNRNFPQLLESRNWQEVTAPSAFGVELLIPVDHYRQCERASKYAILLILVSLLAVFFVEMRSRKEINPVHYILSGLAYVVFNILLLSLSEQIGFDSAFLTAGVMTCILIGFYMRGVMQSTRYAISVAAISAILYLFVYLLIGMEKYALLTGSIAIFILLAAVMMLSIQASRRS